MQRSYQIHNCEIILTIGDITQEKTDAIVNAANNSLMGGGGVDGAIHTAAGLELLAACQKIKKTLPNGMLATGGAIETPGFALKTKHIIHCAGPMYSFAKKKDTDRLLANCYINALDICRKLKLKSVAFPAISTGAYKYPLNEAATVSLRTVMDDLAMNRSPNIVKFILFDKSAFNAFEFAATKLFSSSNLNGNGK